MNPSLIAYIKIRHRTAGQTQTAPNPDPSDSTQSQSWSVYYLRKPRVPVNGQEGCQVAASAHLKNALFAG